MKRLKRKQLKEDEFVTTFNKIVNFLKKWKREFLMGGVALLCALLIFAGFQLIKSQNLKKQNILLNKIFQLSSELSENPDKIAELEELAGRGKYSRMAYLQLGIYWFEQGDFEKALAQLNNIPANKKDLLYYQAQDLAAQIYAEQEKYDEAIKVYEKIEEEKPKDYALDTVMFRKAEALEEKGDTEQALALYKKIQDNFPQTHFGRDASQKITQLEEKKRSPSL
jgi:tetratricopeptide (TPR) repeat protein